MTEKFDLVETIATVGEAVGPKLSGKVVAMMAARLSQHPPADVSHALQRCFSECRGRLTVADVLERMPKSEWWQKPAPPHPDLPAERAARPAIEDGTAGPVMDRRLGQRKFAELAQQIRAAPAPATRPEQGDPSRDENREAIRRAREDLVRPVEARHGEHAEAVARLAASVHAHEWRGILGRLHVVKASDIAVKLSFRSRTEVAFVENNFRQRIAEAFDVPVSAVQIVKGGRPPEEKPEEGKR